MTKLITINKSDLHVDEGYLLDDDDNLIDIPKQAAILEQFHRFVEFLEKAAYLEAQPDASPAPSLEGFNRKVTRLDVASDLIMPDDWAMDILEDKADEKHLIDAALEEVVFTDQVREVAKDFLELFEWAEKETFKQVGEKNFHCDKWDPRLLVITPEEITAGLCKWVEQRNRMETKQDTGFCKCCFEV